MIQYYQTRSISKIRGGDMDQSNSNTLQPISDDQELAKVLAGVTGQTDDAIQTATTVPAVQEESVPTQEEIEPTPLVEAPVEEVVTAPVPPSANNSTDLDTVKQKALLELRPLVDKLNVSPEEKFDTYLLLLRSTDDKALIEPAHEAAKGIVDEARRAQALLDIIKEIDFLTQNK
jgi:hypothetical protein